MKVGDYVRIINTLNSYVEIVKIKELNENDGYLLDEGNYQYSTDEIIKSSSNIIDLIEVGDFVNYEQINGGYVLNKNEDTIDTWAILPNSLKNEDIKSVITREQMKSLEYKVKE